MSGKNPWENKTPLKESEVVKTTDDSLSEKDLKELKNRPIKDLNPKELEIVLANFSIKSENSDLIELGKDEKAPETGKENDWQNEAFKDKELQEIIKEIIDIEKHYISSQSFKGKSDEKIEAFKQKTINNINKLFEEALSILKKNAPKDIDKKEIQDLIMREVEKNQKKSASDTPPINEYFGGKFTVGGKKTKGNDDETPDTFYGIDVVK